MNPPESSEFWTRNLDARPEIFPHQLNLKNDTVLLTELALQAIRQATFLDERVIDQSTRGAWLPWQMIADAMSLQSALPPRYIFHVGHCGSTLLSRLLEFADETQVLREPLPLRTLAQDLADSGENRSFLSEAGHADRLALLQWMWSRGSENTVIKATSICTGLLETMSRINPTLPSIFIYNRPETHIAALLAGDNPLNDLKGFAQLRMQRLQQLMSPDFRLDALSPAHLAAMGWLVECATVNQAIEKSSPVMPLEFDELLAVPADALSNALVHLSLPHSNVTVERALSSPVMTTYSKAPEHRYDSQTRAHILAQSRRRFRGELKTAMNWLEELARSSKVVSATMERFR